MPSNDICEIVVVRHGQTLANRTGVLQGQYDTPLDEVGFAQAEAIAERLKNEHFDAVYSSDLGRAMDTANTIVKYHPDLTVIPSEGLREWNLGDLQGKEYKDLLVQYPAIMDAFKSEGEVPPIPNGESLEDFQNRVSGFMDRIAAENIGKRLLFVSHGGATQRMFTHVTGPLKPGNIRPLCANASLSVFQRRPAGWQLVAWNDISHLAHIKMHDTLTF
ncbi:MAG: histidine phosphatase family protein [Lentisphaeria bacterium]|nr:histidine phosphatase family protein [Lentisphaeria bacterium]MBO5694759.1 histidine phosphatase family protein [Lentisphaeria bacterium]